MTRTNISFTVRRLFNSAPQVKLLLSKDEVLELVPEMAVVGLSKKKPLVATVEGIGEIRFEGYPTASISNQDASVAVKLLAMLGNNEEGEFEANCSLALGEPARLGSNGRKIVKLVI